MKNSILVRFFVFAFCAASAFAADLGNIAPEFTAAGRANDPAVVAAKERFFKWGWGLFVHYGLYSGSGEGEWQMHDERIDSKSYYAERLPLFNPKPTCIDEWIALARDAGMKYIVLTTRHHEGYWLGDDFIRAYTDKVRAAGLGVGVYYSVADWSDPDYRGGPADQVAWGRFVGKAHAQLRHLMTDFGKIDYLFYDGCPPPLTWGCFEINAELRRLQPGLLITRCMDDDLKSCEQNADGGEGLWESCYTLNGSWGYQKHDPRWKSAADVVCKLISIRARGGTMLMNVGPMADGTVQSEAQARLREIGKWVKANADAFYDVKRDPFDGACYEWMTQSGQDPQTVYFQFIRSWGERRLLCGISNKVTRVFFVDTGENLSFTQDRATGKVLIKGYPYSPKGDVPRMAGVTFEGNPVPVYDPCWARFSPRVSGLKEKIAASRAIVREDVWHGYNRIVFDFEGHTAWVVEPKKGPALGCPWTWTMQWADAYVERTGVLDLLSQGWRHVTIDTFGNRMDDEGLRVSRAFQRFLVEELGFAPKANLVGMSWGGFFSVRYAAANPDCVSKIYLDAPLLTFAGFASGGASSTPTALAARIGPWADRPPEDGDWLADARMPVNMAEKVAAAGIPVLLLYGGQDQTVPPALNCELFAERFKAAGGRIDVRKRGLYGHHPHGEDPGQTDVIANFFKSPVENGMLSRAIAPWNGTVTGVSTNIGTVCVDYALRPTDRSLIRCQLLLPAKEKWSGRFWGQGNGGQAGGKPRAMPAFANAGDAVAHTDMGTSDDRAYGNPEAWTDFSHRATHLMTLSAKALIKAHYGRPPNFSYFYGASTGGNQGLMEAERYPDDYDAVLAIVPAFARVPYHVKYVWNARQVFRPDGSRALTDQQIATVEKAVLDWFADKDEPYARGKYLARTFWTDADMDGVLALAASRDPSIGANDIKARFRAVWDGPVINGRRAGLGLPPGARLSTWLSGTYTSKETWLWNWFSDRHRPLLSITDDEIEAWAKGPARQFNATNPDLSRFFARGGVLLMTGGAEDDICEPAPMIAFADEVIARNPAAAKTNFRFYLNPGRAHGGVHRGLCDLENMWSALVAWREKGVAPDVMQGVFDWSEKGFPDDFYGGKSKDARRLPVAPWPDKMSGPDENCLQRVRGSLPAGSMIDPLYFGWGRYDYHCARKP